MSKYSYGARSRAILGTVEEGLQSVFYQAIEDVDIAILCGFRSRAEQTHLYETRASKVLWPYSKHNLSELPEWDPVGKARARAVDFAPYPIDWNDLEKFRAVAFFLCGIGKAKGFDIRLGADWDGDFTWRDQTFHDVGHVELLR